MSSSDLKYRADIDGLRAVAVLPVVLYHAEFSAFSGGYVGVDVFFVISGFLITSIIAGEIEQGTFKLSRFYERRARRLFPALFAVIFASCTAAWWLLLPWEMEDFGQSVATTALFASNFLFFTEAGYFDGPAELKPLLHTWSLAIEEQYYLLFPAFLLLIHRRLSRRFLLWTGLLGLASLILSIWSVARAPDAAFYLLPSRTWELMVGSMIALAPLPVLARWVQESLALLGLGLIGAAVFLFDAHTPFPGAAALLPCLGTGALLIAGAKGETTMVARVLSWRPVVFFGLISYSLYLWHWPILTFAKHYLVGPLSQQQAAVLVLASVIVAVLSWRFIEQPFRGRDAWLTRKGIFSASAAVMVGAIGLGLWFDESEGVPERLPAPVLHISEFTDDKPPERKRCEGIDPQKLTFERACRLTQSDSPLSLVVWGDSHAMAAMPAFREAALRLELNGLNLTSNGCAPLTGVYQYQRDPEAECVDFNARVLELLRDHPELQTVVIMARWARHADGTGFGQDNAATRYLADQDGRAFSTEQNREIVERALARTLAELKALGRQVILVGSVPEIGQHVPDVLAKSAWRGRSADLTLPRAAFEARQVWVNALLTQAALEDHVTFMPVADTFCDAQTCAAQTETGLPLYFDDNHIASTGAHQLVPRAVEILKAGSLECSDEAKNQ